MEKQERVRRREEHGAVLAEWKKNEEARMMLSRRLIRMQYRNGRLSVILQSRREGN